jgi:hypothetical protein
MTTRLALRAEVRELIGTGAYDRNFKPEWTNEGLDFACDQVAALLGLTRQDVELAVTNKHVVMPADAISAVSVQTVT